MNEQYPFADTFAAFQDALTSYRSTVVEFEKAMQPAPSYVSTVIIDTIKHERRMAEHDAKMKVLQLYNRLLTKVQEAGIEP